MSGIQLQHLGRKVFGVSAVVFLAIVVFVLLFDHVEMIVHPTASIVGVAGIVATWSMIVGTAIKHYGHRVERRNIRNSVRG